MARASAAEAAPDTRERILRAALETFSERGFDGARTRDIAARAGVPLGLLQYHFGGKAKLWRASVDRAFALLRGGLEAILEDPGPADDRERLRRLIHGHVHFAAAQPAFIRLMHEEGKRRGPRMRWMVDQHVKPIFGRISQLIERGQAGGVLPADVAPIHLLYILVGAAGVIFHQAEECKRVSGLDPASAPAVEAHARALEQLLLGTPYPEGPG